MIVEIRHEASEGRVHFDGQGEQQGVVLLPVQAEAMGRASQRQRVGARTERRIPLARGVLAPVRS